MKKGLMMFFLICLLVVPYIVLAETYYVDATSGLDSNDGLSETSAWQTIEIVNGGTFNPGDVILFKCGEVWREQLKVPSSGAEGSTITFEKYGEGENPKLILTDLYNNFWENNYLQNGDFDMPGYNSSDRFPIWGEISKDGATLRRDTDEKYQGQYSCRFEGGTEGDLTSDKWDCYIAKNISVTEGTPLHLSFYSKVPEGATLYVTVRDQTDTSTDFFLKDTKDWDSSINWYNFEYNNQDWSEQVINFTTMTDSDPETTTRSLRVYFLADGQDIAVNLDDVYLYDGTDRTGDIISEEYPTRPRGIYISNKSYIDVASIDVSGKSGNNESGPQYPIAIDLYSHHIGIFDLEISEGSGLGIRADYTTSNTTYYGLDVHDNGSTGIYMDGKTGLISHCKSYNNGKISSTGDRGGIGVQGDDIIIEYNEVYSNGPVDEHADMEISCVGVHDEGLPVTIRYNYIHDSIHGAIQLAEGYSNSSIYYNIIDGFGSCTDNSYSSYGNFAGIRIGGGVGDGGAMNVLVCNNIIMNGSPEAGANLRAGISLSRLNSEGATVQNNIFYNNLCPDISVKSGIDTGTMVVDNNIYYREGGTGLWNWKGIYYYALEDWINGSGQDFDLNSIDMDPLFVDANNADFRLEANSPAINEGADVGLTEDFDGTPIPQGLAPEVGALEFIECGEYASTISVHRNAGRAYIWWFWAYAVGSGDYLGTIFDGNNKTLNEDLLDPGIFYVGSCE